MSECQDLVADTHIIPNIIEDRFRRTIEEGCHTVWVPRYIWNREMPAQPWARLITVITDTFDDLEIKGKFFTKSTSGIQMPRDVERALTRSGAKRGDLELVRVAFFRLRRGRCVVILSRDHHITNQIPLLRRYGIGVSDSEDYCSETEAQ